MNNLCFKFFSNYQIDYLLPIDWYDFFKSTSSCHLFVSKPTANSFSSLHLPSKKWFRNQWLLIIGSSFQSVAFRYSQFSLCWVLAWKNDSNNQLCLGKVNINRDNAWSLNQRDFSPATLLLVSALSG